MRWRAAIAAGACLLALGACEKGKPRHPPPDPFAAPPPPVDAPPAPSGGLSAGLAKRPEPAGFFLDRAGEAVDPFNKRPAVTPADKPIELDGFGFDAVAKLPAKGVDMVVDGKAYGTTYGAPRQDVANYFKVPALVNVGFRTALPAGTLKPGPHTALVRVVAADGKGYFDSPTVAFEVK